MSVLDKFELRTIEVREQNGVRSHPAWCYGELFIVRCDLHADDGVHEGWKIGSIPLGAMFPVRRLGIFQKLEDACEAALELVAERSDWSSLQGFGPAERAIFYRIADKYNTECAIEWDKSHEATGRIYLNGTDAANYR